jgi:hypothetical protein
MPFDPNDAPEVNSAGTNNGTKDGNFCRPFLV